MLQKRAAMSGGSPYYMQGVYVLSAHLTLPVLSMEVLQVTGQGLTPVQLCREIDWSYVRMVFVLLNLLLHGRVDKVQRRCASLTTYEEGEK